MKHHRWALVRIIPTRIQMNEDKQVTSDILPQLEYLEYVQCWDCDRFVADAWGTECYAERVPDEVLASPYWKGL